MVRRQLEARGITDSRVLDAMGRIPRHAFVPPELAAQAYDDAPLPIGHEQTISQPYIVALMTEAAELSDEDEVLEVGTGTGYHTAVLAALAKHVWSVERLEPLSRQAGERLRRLGIDNVTLVMGDGAQGFPDAAPYDAIIVAAAAPNPPKPLLMQLGVRGRLVIPLGDLSLQELTVVRRTAEGYAERRVGSCRFVPLVSSQAFGDG